MTDNCKPTFTINDKLPPMTKKVDFENVAEKKAPKVEKPNKGKKKKPKRCQMEGCKKKLSITAYDCRCEKRFCNLHQCAESHDCTFDYKTFASYKFVRKKDDSAKFPLAKLEFIIMLLSNITLIKLINDKLEFGI